MDYIARFGLEFNPFLKNSREIIVENDEYREIFFRLNYLVETKGFGLLTGSPGLGKTTAIRNFAASLNPAKYKVIYSSLSTLTVMEFYRSLVASFGAEPAFCKADNFRIIQENITRLTLEKRITPVTILDEANHISNAILSDLKLLFNFEMDSRDRAVILLAGLPQLNNTMRLISNEPLRQRLVMNYNLEGLTKEEGRFYISEKLKRAGCTRDIFDPNAIEALLNTANGTPRIINTLCNSALLIANNNGHNTISAEDAMTAINDCQLS